MSKISASNNLKPDPQKGPCSGLPEKWLLFRLSSLGDVALATGPMRYWQEKYGWSFTVLTKPAFAPLFENNPAVHAVITPAKEDLHLPAMAGYFRTLASLHKGEGLLDLHGTVRSRLLAMFWKGPVRRYPKHSILRRSYVLHKSPKASQALLEHNVTQRYAMAVEDTPPPASSLLPVVYLTDEEKSAAKNRLSRINSSASFIPRLDKPVALHPYATHFRKAWPAEHWVRLTRELDRHGISWFIVGQGEALFSGDPRDLTGQTSLRELCAFLASSRILITGDSGPMHLAAAAGTPVLALFGPTTKEWGFFPAGRHDQVIELDLPCRPCSLHGANRCRREGECMKKITPETVVNRLLSMLGTK